MEPEAILKAIERLSSYLRWDHVCYSALRFKPFQVKMIKEGGEMCSMKPDL